MPTIIGVVLLALATFIGVFVLNSKQIFRIGANAESAPKDIRVSNINESSLTISWLTDKETYGYILFGESASNVSELAQGSDVNTKSITHTVTLSGLKAETTYYFKINSDGTTNDNGGSAWQAKTISSTTNYNQYTVSGNISLSAGAISKNALVYVNVSGKLFSGLTSESGSFIVRIWQAQELDPNSTLLDIFVEQDSQSVATVKTFYKSANPLPSVGIGQNYDFRNNPANTQNEGESPNTNLSLPENIDRESKFNLPESTTSPTSPVTIQSLDEGETITSNQPEFSGEGPKGETITITVESENPQTGAVTISSGGTWKWAVPDNLTEGAHKITISWIENGITRTLTRNFIVQAGELPAFEATPSQSLASPTATATSTAKATATATATSKATATAIPTDVPETGFSSITWGMIITGFIAVFLTTLTIAL